MRPKKAKGGHFRGFLTGLGAGIIAAYFLDPDDGRRRRAMVRDQARRRIRETRDFFDEAGKDIKNRTTGFMARARSRLRGQNISDEVLEARVRAELGRVVTHPHAVDVTCDDGQVTLTGAVLKAEADTLLAALRAVPGVSEIDNLLEIYDEPGNIPSLQGPGSRVASALQRESWSPALRLIAGSGGALLGLRGMRRGGLRGFALGTLGVGLLARAIADRPVKEILGNAGRAVDFHKTITVGAPLQEVFRFWSHFENFPRFMEHVREVRPVDEFRSHWTVAGPAETPIDYDAVVTRLIPGRIISWRTEPGATVQHSGIVHFEEVPGGTRVDVRMSYRPPAGVIGHAVATLFGADPKRALDEDLLRFKSLMEQGKATAHGQATSREDVRPPEGEPIH